MTKAPLKIWHSIDRRGKLIPTQDAHVKPCASVENAYVEYLRADAVRSEFCALKAQNRDLLEALVWAMSEIHGSTRYDEQSQFENCCDKAIAAIAKAKGEA